MGKKNKSAPSASNTITANESVKKLDNITNIDNEIKSILGEDAGEENYVLFVKQWLTQSDGGNRWSYVGRITGEDMKDVQEKLLEYSSGLYRLEAHYEKSKKKVPGVPEYETAVGNMQDIPRQSVSTLGRRVEIPNPQQNRGSPAQSSGDPVESHPDVVKAKVSAEVIKAKIEQVVSQKQLDKIEKGDDNMDANTLKVSEMQTDKKISDMGNSITNSVNATIAGVVAQMNQNFTTALASLKPSGNGEYTELKNEIRELKSKGEQTSATTLIIKSMEQINQNNLEHMRAMAEKQNADIQRQHEDIQRQHELTLKMMERDSSNKSLSIQQFTDAFQKGMDIALEKESLRIDKISAEAGAGEPEQPWYEKILAMISETLQKLSEDGTLQQMMTKSPEPQPKLLVPPEQMKAISQSITANVIAKVKSGEIKIPGVVINPPATAETKPEKTEPIKTEPTPSVEEVNPEQIKKNIVNAILTNIMVEMDVRPKQIQWVAQAYDNLPEDILNEIVNSKTQADVIAIISKYADKTILISLGAKLLDKKNLNWLMKGIGELKEMAAEENTPDEPGK